MRTSKVQWGMALICGVGAMVQGLVACGAGDVADAADDSASPGRDEEVANIEQQILNGDAVQGSDAWGFVRLTNGAKKCTGVLLQNDLVITAKQCATPGLPSVQSENGVRSATEVFPHASQDVAIVQVSSFVPGANGNRFDLTHRIWSQPDGDLVNTGVLCAGFGASTTAGCSMSHSTFRRGNLSVSAAANGGMTLARLLGGNQMLYGADVGTTCFRAEAITGIATGPDPANAACSPQGFKMVAPSAYRSFANGVLAQRPTAFVHTSTNDNVILSRTYLQNPELTAFTPIHVTHNTTTNNEHLGVFYDTGLSKWAIFNEDGTNMLAGRKFNVWRAPTNSVVHVARNPTGTGCAALTAACNVPTAPILHTSRLELGAAVDSDPNAMLVVTQLLGSTSVHNWRGIGVWFNTSTSRWHLYNEDGSAMQDGATFIVTPVSTKMGAFVHQATLQTISGNATILNNINLNGQPSAQMIVTHNFGRGGAAAAFFHNHPLGVGYDSALGRWKIFNQDGAAMPENIPFIIAVRP